MNHKVKVSAVSYLNTKPLLYGIERHPIRQQIELDLEYPSLIAKHLADGSTDLGLVSTAALLSIPNPQIISDYGIAASGKVGSVCIFSQVPLDRVEKIYLDYQSRTSVRLAEILLKKYWNLEIPLEDAPEQYIDLIEGATAGVIIGDRALQSLDKFEYVYDLAGHWKELTGLDFIFAAWIANKTLPEQFIQDFNAANEMGLRHIDEVVAAHPYSFYDLNVYYRQNIQYKFDDSKREGLHLFLEYIRQLS